ncbi:hypothetical protein EYF80_002173 [Liparis tanakae]|uniref:Secreted protein n=1 Tax=Liparis tanakae TaxID=230148 RepID=A0A4Z2JB84_9TELE|nr:hypothetical protein EYF80_002173 [Liparis tanakae]
MSGVLVLVVLLHLIYRARASGGWADSSDTREVISPQQDGSQPASSSRLLLEVSLTQVVIWIWLLTHDLNPLPFSTTAGPFHRLHHRLNVETVLKCRGHGDRSSFP